MPDSSTEVCFSDTNSRIAFDLSRRINSVARSIPPELPHATLRRIKFDAADAIRGWYAIFMIGTVVGTQYVGVFDVPERTVNVLRLLEIQFITVKH
jgi:hypothetical protein